MVVVEEERPWRIGEHVLACDRVGEEGEVGWEFVRWEVGSTRRGGPRLVELLFALELNG